MLRNVVLCVLCCVALFCVMLLFCRSCCKCKSEMLDVVQNEVVFMAVVVSVVVLLCVVL